MNAAILAGLFAFQVRDAIDLNVDATDGPRNLLRVTELVPAKPGLLTLQYPRWIPGNHRPSGPINEVIDFHVYAGGKELTWRRDPVDLYTIRVQVPDGGDGVRVNFVVGEQPGMDWSTTLGRLRWNRVIFLPPGDINVLRVNPHITAPPGWAIQTALTRTSWSGGKADYETVTAERLIDSPAQLGVNAKTIDVGSGHFFDLLTQEPEELNLRPEIVTGVRNLVRETGEIFGTRHYRQYHYLGTFSSRAAGAGLEHNECCEVGHREEVLKGDVGLAAIGSLYCHEMFHSWNGKYRRPAGLLNPDYMAPQQTELVWVYEGMTEYYGDVLAARSGFATISIAIDGIAAEVGAMSEREGRSWRSVADTSVAASILRDGGAWSVDRRQQDYYSESVATWLEVDATIRRLTQDKKSLDDFCRLFEGGPGGQPAIVTYQYQDVVDALNEVTPNDWNALLQKLVYDVRPAPITEAFAAAGWRTVTTDKPNAMDAAMSLYGMPPDHMGEIGIDIGPTGEVSDMALGSPADRAGFTPGMKVVAVDGRTFSEEALEAAIRRAKGSPGSIHVLVERDGKVLPLDLDYHGGVRRPHLERIPGTHDYLTEILTSRARKP